jgi:hypothetical protein
VTLALLNDVIAGRRARGLPENPPGTPRDAHVKEILGVDDPDLVGRILRDLDQRQLAHNVGTLMEPGAGTSDTGKRLLALIADPGSSSGSNVG